ncbi:hypothetical protein F5887DRAFT_916104 [Amanita rubescens]|nr:hypothetical protein F5887DRAFT_916104 [Amanita rubescens]
MASHAGILYEVAQLPREVPGILVGTVTVTPSEQFIDPLLFHIWTRSKFTSLKLTGMTNTRVSISSSTHTDTPVTALAGSHVDIIEIDSDEYSDSADYFPALFREHQKAERGLAKVERLASSRKPVPVKAIGTLTSKIMAWKKHPSSGKTLTKEAFDCQADFSSRRNERTTFNEWFKRIVAKAQKVMLSGNTADSAGRSTVAER